MPGGIISPALFVRPQGIHRGRDLTPLRTPLAIESNSFVCLTSARPVPLPRPTTTDLFVRLTGQVAVVPFTFGPRFTLRSNFALFAFYSRRQCKLLSDRRKEHELARQPEEN